MQGKYSDWEFVFYRNTRPKKRLRRAKKQLNMSLQKWYFLMVMSSAIFILPSWYTSEIRGLCLMICSSETLQNLPYFWNTKTHADFLFFNSCCFILSQINALVYVNIDQGIHYGKRQGSMKSKTKKLRGFSYSKNMANFLRRFARQFHQA